MARIVWIGNKDGTSTTSFISKNVGYRMDVFLSTNGDISKDLIAGKWYGTVNYSDVTLISEPSISMIEAKIKSLKLLTKI